MKETVPSKQAVTRGEHPLPPRVQEALGELVGVAQEGLLALSVGLGLGVLAELMEEEVTEIVGPKGRHDPERRAVRHGHEAGEVTLGGRRFGAERHPARSRSTRYHGSPVPVHRATKTGRPACWAARIAGSCSSILNAGVLIADPDDARA